MKFMPASTAACRARLLSASSTGPNTPPMVMAPKPMTVTSRSRASECSSLHDFVSNVYKEDNFNIPASGSKRPWLASGKR